MKSDAVAEERRSDAAMREEAVQQERRSAREEDQRDTQRGAVNGVGSDRGCRERNSLMQLTTAAMQ